MMSQYRKPLYRSITIGSSIFIALLALILSVANYVSYRQSMYAHYESQMADLLHYVDSHIDHADLERCIDTLTPSEQYFELWDFIDDVYTNHNIHYLYIIRSVQTEDGPDLMNVVTGLSPQDRAEGEGEIFVLGYLLTDIYEPEVREQFRQMQDSGRMTYFEDRSDYGLDYTAVMPLKNAAGETFALLCLDMPIDSIRSNLFHNTVMHLTMILLMGVLFIICFLLWIRSNVTAPIKRLETSVVSFARISHDQRDPNLLVYEEPDINTENEVESLSKAVALMSADMKEYAINILRAEGQMEKMQTQVEVMDQLANQDALTKIRNKTAYLKEEQRLRAEIADRSARFGILMVDLNNLKQVNDNFGHEHGDSYLIGAVQLICRVCEQCPVFRVGGDEFVVLLEGRAYDNRVELYRKLTGTFTVLAQDETLHPWERYSAAVGLAVYTREDSSVEEVFHRADQQMYRNKKSMKAQRG